MQSVSDTVSINAPVSSVFAALADPEVQIRYDGEMFKAVEKLSPGPIGPGTRFRGRFKGMGNVEYSYDEFVDSQLIQHAVKMPFGAASHRFEFRPDTDGTTLAQSISVRPNLLGKIMWPLVMKRMMTKRVRTLNRLVKGYAEAAT